MLVSTISGRDRARRVLFGVAGVALLVYLLAPIAWIVISSVQTEVALQQRPPTFMPVGNAFTLNHYRYILTGEVPEASSMTVQGVYTMQGTLVYPAILNSLIVAASTTLLTLVLSLPAAHVFSRYEFRGDRSILLGMLGTRLLPSITIVVAMFILFRSLGLLDTKLGLVLVYTAIALPFAIWILRAYLSNLPIYYEEAARLDGCGYAARLWKIVLPLAKPGIFAVGILTFMTAYAEFVLATILTQSIDSQTQTVVLAGLAQGLSISRGMMAAAAVSAMAPPLLLAIVFRNQVLRGLTARFGL